MPTNIYQGREVKSVDLIDLFAPSEGMICQYYGRIGSGKTYSATKDALELLRRGKVVYTNWKIHYEGTDERTSMAHVFLSLVFPWKKRFYHFPSENLHHIEVDKNFHENFAKLTDCTVFLDEGHVVFDSYVMARLDMEKRKSILHTRHFNRSINIISQRPTAVHVTMRANVNIFYKCENLWSFLGFVRFKRTEYQDMLNETVDENEENAISVKYYLGKKRIFDAYDTKYLRGETPPSQKLMFKAYDFSYLSRVFLFFHIIFNKKDTKNTLTVPLPPLDYGKPVAVKLKVQGYDNTINLEKVLHKHTRETRRIQKLARAKATA